VIDLQTERRDDVAVITLDGRLDMVAAQALRNEIDRAVDGGSTKVVLDFAPCSFVDSSGLGAVVGGLKTTRQRGGDLRIACVSGQVGVVLSLTNLDRVLRSHDSVDEAVDALR
jgi:anti-sigma B factor antagonist